MEQYKCLIVEDEPLAAEVLEDYISQVPFLDLKGICPDAIFALDKLQKEKIDLIFLDIHLPKLKGLDFIKTLRDPPSIIITSAYQEYALQGYEHNVVDYLLKPVEFSRFLAAVNKLKLAARPAVSAAAHSPTGREYLFFNVSKKKVKVFLDEILYIESIKEYIRIVVKDGAPILTKFQLGQAEELLANNQFLRVHRSFLVAKDKITSFTAIEVEVGGNQIPVGRSYKESVQTILGSVS